MTREQLAIEVLKGYEAFEAELIADNRCWEPSGMASNPRLTNQLYDKMMQLQYLRNGAIYPDRFEKIGPEDMEVLNKIIAYKVPSFQTR